ncbi:MAG: CAP domain-containing protein [Actinomycetota bacterium]
MRICRSVAIAGILAVGAVLLPVTSVGAHDRAPGRCYRYLAQERSFATLTNHSRSANKVAKLRLDPQLSWVARTHTRAMVRKGTLFHAPGDQITHRITGWMSIGENIGVGPLNSVAGLQKAFMHSPEHRANILNPGYRYVGIGVVAKDDTLWVTLDFEGEKNPGTTLRLPSC